MTTRPTSDSLRPLDAIEAPDQWDDIVRRADAAPTGAELAPFGDPTPGVRRHRLLAAAAVVLVLLAVAGAVALRPDGDQSDRASDPALLWGRRWQLVQVDVGDASITEELVSSNGGAVVLDTTEAPFVSIDICNEAGGDGSIVDGQLELHDWTTEAMGCSDPLEQLMNIGGTTVDATEDRLVLTRPGFRYEFRPVGSLPGEAAVEGRRWMVTELTRPGNEGTLFEPGTGPVLDLRTTGEVVVEGCGPHTKAGRVAGDRLEVEPGRWQELMVRCASTPATEHATDVEAIIDAGATVARDQHSLVVRSSAGSFTAETSLDVTPWNLFADPYTPSTARWAVVSASERDRSRDLIGTPVLTLETRPEAPERRLGISGCGSLGATITDIDEAEGTMTFQTDQGGVFMGCETDEAEQGGWIYELLRSQPTVAALGRRAVISSDGRSLVLVRLD